MARKGSADATRRWCRALTKGNIELGETVLGVSLRDGVEHDRVVQDVVVKGEVTAAKGSDENLRSFETIALTPGLSQHPCP